ncbi:hypothetical protein HYH02_004888 [Chlamydomonas schloesseri]|uniref:Cyclic nucleotide-binding domain-containing protein n=1 Tax=Chlamydomonas schloesseri TaxID=2026947 RepID=A0A835WMT6_9CHLO|nr:hypothetical protein HYH02_004888 [Chlamydomonas schloesseri]|eukprot:KAG2450385.1 hypothetical protein HYH02_004888 [Chlamydomonas schloesseri]
MEPITPDLSLSRTVDILARQPPQRTPADLRKLATYLRGLDGFFHSLDQLDVEIIGKWLGYEFVAAGEPVYREGEFGEKMYIIIGGTCDVFPPAGSAVPSDTALLHVGQAFGELALVAARKPRSRTVAASTAGGSSNTGGGSSSSSSGNASSASSPAGVHLATLHRSTLSHMRFVAAASAEAGRALQAVLAACCMGVLRVPPGSRSLEEVDTLAEFFGAMEAFKKLPVDMVRRLAADAGHVRLPAGRLVFEEDAPGHCMYVVVRGSCAVRARPLAARPVRPGGGGLRGIGMGLRGGGGLKGGGGGGERGFGTALSMGRSAESGSTRGESLPGHQSVMSSARQSSVSRTTAATAAEAADKAGGGSDGGGLDVPGGARGGGGGGGRWGAMGFTTLLTVRAAHKARERHPEAEEGEERGEDGEEEEQEQEGGSPKKAKAPAAAPAPARDSPFWIARFMEDALKRLHVGDSSAGLGQAMTPLAAVAAARWRAAAAARRSNGGGGGGEVPAAPEAEGADAAAAAAAEGDGQAMEALLGRAAARALRAAVSVNRLRGAGVGAAAAGKKPDGGAYVEEEEEEGQEQQEEGAPNPAEAVAASGLAAAKGEAAGEGRRQVRKAGHKDEQGDGEEEEDEGDDRLGPLNHDGHHHHPLTEPSLLAHSGGRGMPGALSAAGGGRMTAIEDPAKRLLSQVGRADPSAVSRTLMGELVQRADVNVVLYEVAKKMVRRGGGPRRISRTASKHIQRALQQQIRAGPDRLQPTVQGQRVLGRHPSVGHGANYYGGGGGGGGGALRASGEGPWGGSGEPAPRVSGSGSATTWGGEGGRRSYNGGGGGAYSTRPVSAMTSGASVWYTEGGTTEYDECDDDGTDFDWNGSDLFSVVSYGKRSTAAGGGSQYGGGRRRTTLQDLPDNCAHTGVNMELMSPAELEAVYGPVIRVVGPGQSFGELALLHRDARRTATVVALPPSGASLGPETSSGAAAGAASAAPPPRLPMLGAGPGLTPELSSASMHGGGGGGGGDDDGPAVDLICIHRHTYNHTVRAVQVAQLQSLLAFLGGLAPFRGLDERQRAALAVFCRPREVAAGAVLAAQGEPANALWMVQEGEVVLLDSSCGVAETLMAQPGGASRTALLRNISAPAGHAAGAVGGIGSSGGRLLLRQLSAPEVQRVAAAAGGRLPPVALGVRKEAGGGGGRVMFDSGASAAEQQRAAASGAAPDGPLRHVAPGALLGLGGTLAALGPGGLFGEGLLANLQKDQPPAPGAAWEDDGSKGSTAASSRSSRARPLRHTAPPPPPHPCTVIARRPTKLLYISAHDLTRFAELVGEPLSQLAAARGDFLATRTASVSAAKEAVSERVADARRVLSDLRHMQAAGVPVASNPQLVEDLRQEHVAAAAARAAESEHPPPPPMSAAAREAAEAAAAIQMIQAAGGRVRGLLPGGGVGILDLTATATAARRKPPSGTVSSARIGRGGRSSGDGAGQPLNRVVQQLHPIAGRLAACLHDSTPKLPPRLPPTPPADGVFGGGGGGGGDYRPMLRQLSEASSAAAHSLSTIQEESSSGMLRAAGVLLTQRRDLMTVEALMAPAGAAAAPPPPPAGEVAVESSGDLWREEEEQDGMVEQEHSEEAVLPSSAAEAVATVRSTQGAVKQMAEQLQSFYRLLEQVPGSREGGGARPHAVAATTAAAASHTSGATVLPPLHLRLPTLTSPKAPAPAAAAAAAATQPQLPALHSMSSLGRTDSRRRPSHHGFMASPSASLSARTAPGGLLFAAAQDSAAAHASHAGEYAPPSLDSVSQASLRSYPSIGPTASVIAAGLTSMGGPLVNESSSGSLGGGGGGGGAAAGAARTDLAEVDTPSRLYGSLREGGGMGVGVGGPGGARGLLPALNHPHRQVLVALAGGGGGGGPPSRGSHADTDSLAIYSDDGSTSPDLSMLSREVAGGHAGGATGGSTPGVVSPPPLSHPRRPMAAVRRSTSNISEGLVQLLAATPADLPSTPTAAAAAAIGAAGGAPFGGRVSLSGGRDSGGRILEAPGAALDVVVGGRPRSLSRGNSMRSTGGGYRTSMSGANSRRVSLTGGGSVASPHLDLLSAAVAAATTFGAASAEAGVAAGGGASAATAAAAARAPLQLLTPMESMDTVANQLAVATAAAAVADAPATAMPGEDTGDNAGDGPLLPWSYVDGADFGPPTPQEEQQQHAGGVGGEQQLVPPLSLAALKLRPRIFGEEYSSDGGSLLGGADSGACSPRAAMTDSPLRARRGAGGFESPVHSPRLVSHVY